MSYIEETPLDRVSTREKNNWEAGVEKNEFEVLIERIAEVVAEGKNARDTAFEIVKQMSDMSFNLETAIRNHNEAIDAHPNLDLDDGFSPDKYIGYGVPTVAEPNPTKPEETGLVRNVTEAVNHSYAYANYGREVVIDSGIGVGLPIKKGMSFQQIADAIGIIAGFSIGINKSTKINAMTLAHVKAIFALGAQPNSSASFGLAGSYPIQPVSQIGNIEYVYSAPVVSTKPTITIV